MKKRCCRSLPRCTDCPVVAAAVLRRQDRNGSEPGVLVTEILSGSAARPLPPAVAAALASLEDARAIRLPPAASQVAVAAGTTRSPTPAESPAAQ
jgi:hypothetical protein